MGSGVDKRRRVDAVMAARMKAEGRTVGEIAAAIGVNRDQVPDRVALGERLLTLADPINATDVQPGGTV